jgi:hypothetical protein
MKKKPTEELSDGGFADVDELRETIRVANRCVNALSDRVDTLEGKVGRYYKVRLSLPDNALGERPAERLQALERGAHTHEVESPPPPVRDRNGTELRVGDRVMGLGCQHIQARIVKLCPPYEFALEFGEDDISEGCIAKCVVLWERKAAAGE